MQINLVSAGMEKYTKIIIMRWVNIYFRFYPALSLTIYIYIYIHIHTCVFTNTPNISRSIFKWSLTSLNSDFSFSYTSYHTKLKQISLSSYLPIGRRRIIESIHFPRVLVLCEMQTALSRVRTRVALSIYYDTTHYTITKIYIYIYIYIYI